MADCPKCEGEGNICDHCGQGEAACACGPGVSGATLKVCPECDGSGVADACEWCDGYGKCRECRGTGKDRAAYYKGRACLACDGDGKCYECRGTGTKVIHRRLATV